jgi:hypothetical protein
MNTSLETLVTILDKTMQEKNRLESLVLQLEEKIKDLTTPQFCTLADMVREDFLKVEAAAALRPPIPYEPPRKRRGRPRNTLSVQPST